MIEKKNHILIVQNSIRNATLLKKILEANKYKNTDITDNDDKLIDNVKSSRPDLLIVDTSPRNETDSIKVLEQINSVTDVPVIFITGQNSPEFSTKNETSDSFVNLHKPFGKKELLSVIDTLLLKYKIKAMQIENEEFYKTIFNNIKTIVIVVDAETDIIVNVNLSASKIFGLPVENIINKKRNAFIFPEQKGRISDWYRFNIKKVRESVVININGDAVPILQKINKVTIAERDFFIINFIDISEQKNTALKLKQAHSEMQALLSSLVTILIGISVKDIITHWNQVSGLTFGIKAADIIGKNFMACGIDWDWTRVYEGITMSISEMRPVKLDDLSYVNRMEKEGFLDLRINPIIEKDGSLGGFLINGEDITKRKELEKQLSRAQKLESIGQLSSGIAHEINTPAQYITDNVYFLRDAFSDILEIVRHNIDLADCFKNKKDVNDKVRKMIKTVSQIDTNFLMEEIPKAIAQSIEGLNRVTRIVKSMKQFSHPGTKSRTLLNINNLLDDTITISRNEWKYSSNIITNFDHNLPMLPCFPGELNQAFLNIIINSSDAIKEKTGSNPEEKGAIEISTYMEDNMIVVTITDTGAGIPEDIQDKIFDPFFTTKEAGKGSGQGLPLTYDIIVNKHKGSIDFKSKRNKGTLCTVRLPL
ncbi:MAG: PAS domain S-box protein [Spirochaetes bacterium]|nr:PAS domain S-box protein [Spirochaetota bacterium]